MKSVAIITRTKNRSIFLKRALKSILNQTFKDFCWVLVNDGGDIVPVEEIAFIAKKNGVDTILINNETTKGMEAASNIGIRHSNSEYLVIHDDDDTWERLFLEKAVSFMRSNNGLRYGGVITHTMKIEEIMDGDKCRFWARSHYNRWINAVYLIDVAKVNSFPPISFLYRRELFEKIGGYDESLPVLGDWDFNLKFMLIADIAVIHEPLANYHQRINKAGDIYGNTVIQGIEKHHEFDAIIRNRFLRNDLNNNNYGLGSLVNIAKKIHDVENALINISTIKRFFSDTSLGRIYRRLFR